MVDEVENSEEWMHYYHSALLELDSDKLRDRIQKAEGAIRKRLQSPTGGEESRAIRDALQNLHVLKQELPSSGAASRAARHDHPEFSGEYVVFVDANRRYVDVTDGVCSLLGYSRAELLGKTIDEVAAPEIRSTVSETFQQFVDAGGLSGQFLLLARDGRRVPIRYDSKVFPDGCLVAKWEPLPSAA